MAKKPDFDLKHLTKMAKLGVCSELNWLQNGVVNR